MQDSQFGNHPQIDATLFNYVVFFALGISGLVKIASLESCRFLGLQSGFQVVSKAFFRADPNFKLENQICMEVPVTHALVNGLILCNWKQLGLTTSLVYMQYGCFFVVEAT